MDLPQLRDEEAEQSEEVLPAIEHRLTHLLLRIYPVRLPIPAKIPAAWKAFTKEQIKTEALPTPIRKTAAGSTLVLGGDGVQSTMANDDTFV